MQEMASFWSLLLTLLLHLQAVRIKSLISWPGGNYGLLKPITGCPEEWTDKEWTRNIANRRLKYEGWTDKGFILQDTLDTYPSNNRSNTLHIQGSVGPFFVLRYFCVKKSKSLSKKWPKGQYCIYGYEYGQGARGWIKMYDEKNVDYNHASKFVKDFTAINGRYTLKGLLIRFNCQVNGNRKIPIELPITKPFYLLPYGSRDCQQVKWMVALTEWIKYHTRNYEHWPYRSYYRCQTYREVPYHEMGSNYKRGITMYYCYYQSCNSTLNETKGVFQSPGFPGKYPDGQLCSWRIMVPANHTVYVTFTNFSLVDNDVLKFFRNSEGSFKLNDTFSANRHPSTQLTAKSDLIFVFHTNKADNSTGFRAEYSVFIPSKTTTTSLSTTIKPLSTAKRSTTEPQKCESESDDPTTKTTQASHFNMTSNQHAKSVKEPNLFGNDLNWTIVVMVIPLVCCILIIVLVVDIVYRCRLAKKKAVNEATDPRSGDFLAVNMTYERGDIILNHPNDADNSGLNTVDDHPLPQEPPDYEDVDYTQLNGIPPPNRDTGYSQCHVLEPLANGAPGMFYHVSELPSDLSRPTYENLSEVSHYTQDPVYEVEQNSGSTQC